MKYMGNELAIACETLAALLGYPILVGMKQDFPGRYFYATRAVEGTDDEARLSGKVRQWRPFLRLKMYYRTRIYFHCQICVIFFLWIHLHLLLNVNMMYSLVLEERIPVITLPTISLPLCVVKKKIVNDELKREDEISPELLNVIEESKIAVIIFLKDYASSTWCMNELEKILECHEMNGQKVIPAFYHLDPFDVRKQTGRVGESFDEHEK
ncbi:TIR disease resistance protein [Melia azedarach]|uniref:TIR disease resistance protein n=1 Tax=Melia azedarach TaxID=155640 RepID=A0ACC1YIU9_MELAZ|nr:TIR disease resistance protein [Melia azedarach]